MSEGECFADTALSFVGIMLVTLLTCERCNWKWRRNWKWFLVLADTGAPPISSDSPLIFNRAEQITLPCPSYLAAHTDPRGTNIKSYPVGFLSEIAFLPTFPIIITLTHFQDSSVVRTTWQRQLINWLHWAVSLRSRQLLSYPIIYQHFMEPGGSLPCSHELTTSPYPEPDESSPCHFILYL
jgi:hypothetical protein